MISVGAVIRCARSRRSYSGVAKLRHSDAAVRTPSSVRALATARATMLSSLAVCAFMYARTTRGITRRVTASVPISRQNAAVNGLFGTNPPVFTNTRPLTNSGRVIASRAAADPPTELPISTISSRFNASTMSSRTSASNGPVTLAVDCDSP